VTGAAPEDASAPFIRPDVRAFLAMLKANPRPQMTAATIAQMRPLAPQGMALLEPPVGDLAVVRDVTLPGPGGAIAVRMFDARAERDAGPVAVFFHGGGFVIGGIDTHVAMCAEIARRLDVPVVSVEYRLAPENPWPAAPDDAEAAARWIADNGPRFGRAFTGLILCGDSAGATLMIVTALALRDRPAALPVVMQIALYPAVDRHGHYPSGDLFSDGYGLDAKDMAFYNEAYDPHPTDWRGVPLNARQEGLPPTLIVTAGLDPLRDQGRAYAAKLSSAGVTNSYVEVAGVIHGFLGFRRAIPSAAQDLIDVLACARAMLDHGTGSPG
jgi:acetyl esterase